MTEDRGQVVNVYEIRYGDEPWSSCVTEKAKTAHEAAWKFIRREIYFEELEGTGHLIVQEQGTMMVARIEFTVDIDLTHIEAHIIEKREATKRPL